MKYLLWTVVFLVARLLEVSFLPHIFGSSSPGFSHLALATAFALLPFRSAFLAALGWGFVIDLSTPPGEATSAVVVALALFLIVRVGLVIVPWDEPLRRIAGLGVGLALFPAAWWIGIVATRALFGILLPIPVLGDLSSSVVAIGAVVAFFWFILFSIFAVYRYRSAAGVQLKLL